MPGVVHEDIDFAEFSAGRSNDVITCGVLRQIRHRIFGPAAVLRDFFRGRGEFPFRTRREKHRCAFFCEQMRDGPADASARAGDEGNLIFQHHGDNEDKREAATEQGAPRRFLKTHVAQKNKDKKGCSGVCPIAPLTCADNDFKSG
jgi:hypothetical protein